MGKATEKGVRKHDVFPLTVSLIKRTDHVMNEGALRWDQEPWRDIVVERRINFVL